MSLGLREVQNLSCDVYKQVRSPGSSAPFTQPLRQSSFTNTYKHWAQDSLSEEGFVLCKALTQTSSWVSCNSNLIICSPSLPTKHFPNMLIYPNMPTYSTEQSCDFQIEKTPDLLLDKCAMRKHFLMCTRGYHKRSHIHAPHLCAHISVPRYIKAHTAQCTHASAQTPLLGQALGAAVFVHLRVASVN